MDENEEIVTGEQDFPHEPPPEVTEAPQPPPDDGRPIPAEFDDYDKYIDSLTSWKVEKAHAGIGETVAKGVRNAIRPPQPDLPDDEFSEQRREALEWEQDCLEKARTAEQNGRPGDAQAWRDRSRFLTDELKKLGPTVGEQAAEAQRRDEIWRSMLPLGEGRLADHPIWKNARMIHDSEVQVHRHNRIPGNTIFILPAESERGGTIEPISPSHMRFVEVPPDVAARIKYSVYGDPAKKADFRKLWAALHASGYAGAARPTYGPSPEQSPEEE